MHKEDIIRPNERVYGALGDRRIADDNEKQGLMEPRILSVRESVSKDGSHTKPSHHSEFTRQTLKMSKHSIIATEKGMRKNYL